MVASRVDTKSLMTFLNLQLGLFWSESVDVLVNLFCFPLGSGNCDTEMNQKASLKVL